MNKLLTYAQRIKSWISVNYEKQSQGSCASKVMLASLKLPWNFPPYVLYSWIVKRHALNCKGDVGVISHEIMYGESVCVFWARDAWNQKKLHLDRGGNSAVFLDSCESSAGLTEVWRNGHSEQCKLWPLCVSASWGTRVVEVATQATDHISIVRSGRNFFSYIRHPVPLCLTRHCIH